MDRRNLVLFVAGGLIVALALAFFVGPLASGSPDGLERVAIEQGFAETADPHAVADGPLADYAVRGVEDEGLSTGIAGVIGVVVTFGLSMVLFALLRTLRARRPSDPAGP